MQAQDIRVETARARSTAFVTLPVYISELPQLVDEVARSSRRFTAKSIGQDEACLTVGITWRAWAGRLHLQFAAVNETTSRVKATWSPTLKTTVIDYGQGAKDIRRLFVDLLEASAR